MTDDQKKRGVFLALLVVMGIGNVLVLYKGHLLSGSAFRNSTHINDFLLTTSELLNVKLHPEIEIKPDNLVLLKSHPEEIEPELKTGRWLILEYSVYNVQDAAMQRKTVAVSQRIAHLCRVAIRPTKGFEDIPKWLPQSKGKYEDYHPVWFALENGELLDTTGFWLSEDEIRQFVEKAFGN